jgi:hypothetical protein
MKIITVNVKEQKFNNLIEQSNDNKDEILFVNWLPTDTITNDVRNQVNTITDFLHNQKQVIVFDRFSILTNDEIKFFVKNNVILYEPVINHRKFFDYLPYWIDLPNDYPLEIFNKRKYSITFDNHQWEGINLLGKTIHYKQDSLCNENKYKLFINNRLPDVTDCIKHGTIPLLFHTNKWFHAMFTNSIIKDIKELDYYLKLYKHCAYGLMIEFNNNIKNYMPEMLIENFIENLISILK